jgi:glycosyltransferase involved in cell wall biosynthesis
MKPRIAFVVEQALGHVAYGQSLRVVLENRGDIEIVWMPVPYEPTGAMRAPLLRSNWTLRGSLRARAMIKKEIAERGLDGIFLHTQTIALFASGFAQRLPIMLSLDATPINLDSLASAYVHRLSPGPLEHLKLLALRRVVKSATVFTTWSHWAKQSLVDDYGAPADHITVIRPGTNLANYPLRDFKADKTKPLQVLFVGGDFLRKGGDVLMRSLAGTTRGDFELHLVTADEITPTDRVRVYQNLKPHSPELLRLYNEADIFALPTRGDCLAVVLGEAMAASLPVITTPVGAHPEVVRHGHNGWIVPLDDANALRNRIMSFADDRKLVDSMGRNARKVAEGEFNIDRCANSIGDMLSQLVGMPTLGRGALDTNLRSARLP